MKYCTKLYVFFILAVFSFSCKQEIAVKDSKLTANNPISYTDVIYKSEQDTVLTATFDGKIREVIRGDDEKKLIIDLSEEVYSLAYNADQKLIYAATLTSGIMIINEEESAVEGILPIKDKWASKIVYDPQTKVLLTADYGGNSYLWQTNDDYKVISVPESFAGMVPKTISGNVLYLDGNSVAGVWDLTKDQVDSKVAVTGQIVDSDKEGNILSFSHNEFMVYDTKNDSLKFTGKHPNWPIYVASMDTLVRVPESLYLTTGLLSENHVYTSSIDRSIRKWDKNKGRLIEDLLGHRATISAMDISKAENQLVSVDLKGGIKFWDLE